MSTKQVSPLTLEVFTSPTEALRPGQTYSPITSTLVSGQREAILIDAQLTFQQARNVAEWVRASGKHLTTIYITHGHGDHYFGIGTIRELFPNVRAVTTPAVARNIQETLDAGVLSTFWEPALGPLAQYIPAAPVIPEALEGNVIELEGRELQIVEVGQSDTFPTTVVHIPSLDAVVAGDVAYNGIHVYMVETDEARREAWIESLNKIEGLKPKIIVVGHKRPEAPDNIPAAILSQTRNYIRDFSRAFAESENADALIAKMLATYGDLGNPGTLWFSANAMFRDLDELRETLPE